MSEIVQHDPRTKKYIKDSIYSYLYDPVLKRFKQQLDSLITRNTALMGYSHLSFVYKGELYSCDVRIAPRKHNKLATALYKEMDVYLYELDTLNSEELPYVLGFVTKVLNTSNSFSDYLKIFPSSVHYPIQEAIKQCPCRSCVLTPEKITELKESNKGAISMLKNRLAANLLI